MQHLLIHHSASETKSVTRRCTRDLCGVWGAEHLNDAVDEAKGRVLLHSDTEQALCEGGPPQHSHLPAVPSPPLGIGLQMTMTAKRGLGPAVRGGLAQVGRVWQEGVATCFASCLSRSDLVNDSEGDRLGESKCSQFALMDVTFIESGSMCLAMAPGGHTIWIQRSGSRYDGAIGRENCKQLARIGGRLAAQPCAPQWGSTQGFSSAERPGVMLTGKR